MTTPLLSDFDGEARARTLYRQVAEGESFTVPLTFSDLERAAKDAIPEDVFGFIAHGAGLGRTTRDNVRAFDRWRIRPRVMRDISERTLLTTVIDEEAPPMLCAPIGGQELVADDGECASARAAATVGTPYILSSGASRSLETVSEVLPGSNRWFQLYMSAEDRVSSSFIDRARAAGYRAIVVTVDSPVRGWRPLEMEFGFSSSSTAFARGNYFTDPAFREGLTKSPEEDPEAAVNRYHEVLTDASHTWTEFESLLADRGLPVLAKGITRASDARSAINHGADGIIVSNHGGNHLDNAVPSVAALPEIVDAVGEDIPVFLDGGVRSGVDIFCALALGADAVLIGRPYLYGLAIAGEAGAKAVLLNLAAEFDLTMALCGCTAPDEIDRSDVVSLSSVE